KQTNMKLSGEHSQFLETHVEKHPTCIVKDATQELCEPFDDLSACKPTRTQPKVSEANMMRPVAWSKKGTPADVEVPTQRGVNLSVLGCMSWYGLLALS
ncbi:hypothetical protein BX666DRAFT_1838852, partial [Dichotomocladium elegans]